MQRRGRINPFGVMRAIRRVRANDPRCCFERVHDQVLERLQGTPQEVEYLDALFTFDPAHDGLEAYYVRVERFLTEHERRALRPQQPLCFAATEVCVECGGHAWELDESRGERVCQCGAVRVCDPQSMSTKYLPFDRIKVVQHTYRRITHFTAVLDALMTRKPPAPLLNAVRREMQKQRVDPARLTHARLRELMHATKMQEHYPLAPTLLAHVKGHEMPRLGAEEIRKLHAMFGEVQHAFDEVIGFVDRKRRNFVSYPFLLRMCLLHLGRADLAAHLLLLKTPEKQRKQVCIWNAIAKYLKW